MGKKTRILKTIANLEKLRKAHATRMKILNAINSKATIAMSDKFRESVLKGAMLNRYGRTLSYTKARKLIPTASELLKDEPNVDPKDYTVAVELMGEILELDHELIRTLRGADKTK